MLLFDVGLGWVTSDYISRGLGWVGSVKSWVGLGWFTESGPTAMSGPTSTSQSRFAVNGATC